MSEQNEQVVTPTPTARTRLVVIDTPRGEDPTIQFHRQRAVVVDGQAFVRPTGIVTRRFSAVAKETVTLADGRTLSAADIAEAISLFGDAWDAEEGK